MVDAPMTFPSPSLMGEMVTETGMIVPSLRKAFCFIIADQIAAPDARHVVEQFITPVHRKQDGD